VQPVIDQGHVEVQLPYILGLELLGLELNDVVAQLLDVEAPVQPVAHHSGDGRLDSRAVRLFRPGSSHRGHRGEALLDHAPLHSLPAGPRSCAQAIAADLVAEHRWYRDGDSDSINHQLRVKATAPR
jgi:hypothetical protein